MSDKKPKYIEGIGWRYDTEHNQKRRYHKHRYNDIGTYLVTIVVQDRMPVFGRICDSSATVLSPLGVKVLTEELPKIHAIYPMVEVWKPICIMPDHLHLIIRINSILPPKKHLGTIIGAFKGGVSRVWWNMNAEQATDAPGDQHKPLFEDNYNDRILMRDNQLANWKAYLNANPYRWFIMHTRPELMRRALCLVIGGIRYGAFGNFMLLRHPEKIQVFFHRKMEDDRPLPHNSREPGYMSGAQEQANGSRQKIPTEQTVFWQKEHERLIEVAEQGDVLVTPGISECEKRIKNECLNKHYRLIHLQNQAIGTCWKPEKSRFEACAAGTLLILAPWAEDLKGDSDYDRFHNLNALASTICSLDAITAMRVIKEAEETSG